VSEGTSPRFSTNTTGVLRTSLAGSGLVLWILCFVSPFRGWAQHYEFVQATQYSLISLVVPFLIIVGSPWRWLGVASVVPPTLDDDGRVVAQGPLRRLDNYAIMRTRHESNTRSLWLLGLFLAVNIFWRVAPVVDFVVRHDWVVVFESLSLVLVGMFLWTELVESPPIAPRTTRPYRVAIAAIAMWVFWILAYINAMSGTSFYTAFHHLAGHGVSQAADQQIAASLLWFFSAVAFVPVIYWNLVRWLQSEENPTDELNRMIRRQRWIDP
jgi:cytochrome c oxidase assembly factor CtaG